MFGEERMKYDEIDVDRHLVPVKARVKFAKLVDAIACECWNYTGIFEVFDMFDVFGEGGKLMELLAKQLRVDTVEKKDIYPSLRIFLAYNAF